VLEAPKAAVLAELRLPTKAGLNPEPFLLEKPSSASTTHRRST
jgi:hypothetical protein